LLRLVLLRNSWREIVINTETTNGNVTLPESLWGYSKRLQFIQRAIAGRFPDRARETIEILDIGCGNGTQVALPLIQDGYRVMGVDMDSPSIDKARRLSGDMPGSIFLHGTLKDVPAEKAFDVVILAEVLEHIHEPRLLLADAAERVRADGLVIVTTPNGYGEFELDNRLSRVLHLEDLVAFLKRTAGRNHNHQNGNGSVATLNLEEPIASTENHECGHLQFFTLRRLNRIFRDCRLSVIQSAGSSFLSGPMVCRTFGRSRRFIEWNARVTDSMPLWLASGWFFALRPLNVRPDATAENSRNGQEVPMPPAQI
jgi:SAM-dependent methyltransferase